MRVFIVIAVVVLILALVGWITFTADRQRPGVHLEMEAVREDAHEAKEAAERVFDRARTTLEGRTGRDASTEHPSDTAPDDLPPPKSSEETGEPIEPR